MKRGPLYRYACGSYWCSDCHAREEWVIKRRVRRAMIATALLIAATIYGHTLLNTVWHFFSKGFILGLR